MRLVLAALIIALMPAGLAAQVAPASGGAHAVVVMPDQVSWKPAPSSLPAGAQAAVLEGNPAEEGPFTMRLSLPNGYQIPPHYHPAVERVTVIKGTFRVGMGDKVDRSAMTALPTGTFAALQPGTRHFAEAEGNTVVQVNGSGPWKLVYVNPADDPRNKTP